MIRGIWIILMIIAEEQQQALDITSLLKLEFY